MPYETQLIANIREGQRTDTEPWLIPADAFREMKDAYIDMGIIKKRSGYFKYGEFVAATANITAGTPKVAETLITATSHGLSNGNLVAITNVTGMTELNGGIFIVSDQAANTFKIKYTSNGAYVNSTGFAAAGVGGIISLLSKKAATGIMTYVDQNGDEDLFISNEDRLCKYNKVYNHFEPIVDVTVVLGYGNGSTFTITLAGAQLPWVPLKIITGSVTVTTITTAGATITATDNGATPTAALVGAGFAGASQITWATGALTVTTTSNVADGAPIYLNYTFYGDHWQGADTDLFKSINYDFIITNTSSNSTQAVNGLWMTNGYDRIVYWDGSRLVCPLLDPVTQRGTWASLRRINACTDFVAIAERLMLTGVKEGGSYYNNRIRWCEAGQPTIWDDTVGGRGDYFDVATGETIKWAEELRNAVMVAFDNSHYKIDYTGDPGMTFTIRRISSEFPTDSKNFCIRFDDFIVGVGRKAIYAVDLNGVTRIDQKIPDFVLNSIDLASFNTITGIKLTSRDEMWMSFKPITPSEVVPFTRQVLAWNFEDDAWSVYNIPFTCFGEYQTDSDRTFDSFPDETFADFPGSAFDSFYWQSSAPVIIGGTGIDYSLEGFIWHMQKSGYDHFTDDLMGISALTSANPCVVTAFCDHGFVDGDSIYINNVLGFTPPITQTGINDRIFTITTTGYASNRFALNYFDTTDFSAYTPTAPVYPDLGTYGKVFMARPIAFEVTSANWNPYNKQGKDTRLGYIDFYLGYDDAATINVDWMCDGSESVYQTNTLDFDGSGDINWKRLHSGATANNHAIRMYDYGGVAERVEVHALRLATEPVGSGIQ